MGFAELTAVEQVAEGEWTATVAEGYRIGDVPNGGFAAVHGVRAMLLQSGRPDPFSITTHFLRPSEAGPATIRTELVRSGRLMTTVSASLEQGGKQRLQMLGVFGDFDLLDGPTMVEGGAEIPDRSLCGARLGGSDVAEEATSDSSGAVAYSEFVDRIDCLLDPATVATMSGEPSQPSPARVSGWNRHADGSPIDAASLIMFADAFPPPIFNTGWGPSWVPTVELTVHFRRRVETEWIAMQAQSRFIDGGLLEEDGELYDDDGNLLALSRQLGLVLAPPR